MEQLRWGKYSYKFAKGHLTWIARGVFDRASGQFWECANVLIRNGNWIAWSAIEEVIRRVISFQLKLRARLPMNWVTYRLIVSIIKGEIKDGLLGLPFTQKFRNIFISASQTNMNRLKEPISIQRIEARTEQVVSDYNKLNYQLDSCNWIPT